MPPESSTWIGESVYIYIGLIRTLMKLKMKSVRNDDRLLDRSYVEHYLERQRMHGVRKAILKYGL